MKRKTKETDPRAKGRIILFLIIIFVLILGIALPVLLIPFDKVPTETANSSGNIMNGGKVAEGGGRIFFTDDSGIYSFAEDNAKEISMVDDSPADKLFYQSGKLYFSQNGSFYSCYFDGTLKTELFSEFDDIQINGNWLYYLRNGKLRKIRFTDGKYDKILAESVAKFYVISQNIYYLGDDGKIYQTDSAGNSSEFIKESSSRFMIDGQYLFRLGEKGVRSHAMSKLGTGDDLPGEIFNVSGENYFYVQDGILYYKNLSSEKNKNKKLCETDTQELYVYDEFVYYRQDGAFFRIRSDGTEEGQLTIGN